MDIGKVKISRLAVCNKRACHEDSQEYLILNCTNLEQNYKLN